MRNVTAVGMTALLLMATLWGCGRSNGITLDANGKHQSDWVSKHAGFFRSQAGAIDDPAVARTSACAECHGTDLKGGISKVSCFSQGFGAATCHFHPVGYQNPANHGAVAKGAPAFNSGMDSCRGCHGSNYTGGLLTQVSCFPCHGVNAPHAANWALSTTSDHTNTNPNNAAACAQCHAGGNLLTHLAPPPPQPAGTPPGCFNATLCHGSLHPDGWIDPAQHGVIAKSQPGSDKGFTSCQVCHGQNFAGGASGVSCFTASRANGSCHIRNGLPVNAPHAALPWRATAPSPTHTSTVDDAQGLNAGVCAQCHLKGANLRTQIITTFATGTPGCFNSTLCHGQIGHPLGWADPSQHGATGKANLTFCQTCHADKPTGGAGSNPRFNVALGRLVNGCEDCHEPLTAHPPVLQVSPVFGPITNPDPLNTPWFRHRTATNFTDVCDRCHGVNLAGGNGPRCQSCHVAALPTTTINSPDPCSSCHSNPPSGTSYPNINRAHISHANTVNVASGGLCAECHSGLGSGTLDHFLRAKNIRLGLINPVTQTSAQPNAVSFGGVLSRANGASPTYVAATLTCSNTYCHGVTLVGGTNKTPRWDQTDYLAGPGCGVCHGFPPANGVHAGFTSTTPCAGCHSHVNSANNGFTDQSKHINGTIDVSGSGTSHSVPFFTHNATAAASCMKSNGGCHNTGTGAIAYPNVKDAVTGAPDCMSCHTLADPLGSGNGLGNCRSCHGTGGTADTAPPTGTIFPNIKGTNIDAQHPNHNGSLCGDCHLGVDPAGRSGVTLAAGSGSGVNHGPNKTKLNGTVQTNSVQTVIGITPNSPRGSGSTCIHSNLPNNNCHAGPVDPQSWTTP